jgi:hypothetical protein
VTRIPPHIDTCDAEAVRDGQSQPCDKTAIALADADGTWWPVCGYHARGRPMVPLAVLVDAERPVSGPVTAGPTGCPASLNVAGRHFDCDWPSYPHRGWPHTSAEMRAQWTDDRNT